MTVALMVQGTTSDAGKSVLVAGLCRVLARRGVKVAPFKPQNMSLNSAVTADGGEIGRAQALQAQAAGIAAHTDMNPVLLKPSSDIDAQVVIHGKVTQQLDAQDYHQYKTIAMDAVMESWGRLLEQYDALVVEGAGSPAEINLRDRDIANMGFAERADVPVILIADIDRGGVFAHLTGTLDLLSSSEQQRIKGFVINRFRGDIALLQSGLDWLEQRTGKPVLGVIPYLHNLMLDAEDAISEQVVKAKTDLADDNFRIVVPVFSRISNHTDFEALHLQPGVDLIFVGPNEIPPAADLIILPGTKNVRADLKWLHDNAWEDYIRRHLRYGGKVLGVCGGYQILGREISDPIGIEGPAGTSQGLNLLPIDTVLAPEKVLTQTSGTLRSDGSAIRGYEIHCGTSRAYQAVDAFLELHDQRAEGAISADSQVAGTYLHGLFDTASGCAAILSWAGFDSARTIDRDEHREQELDRLADCLEQNLDLNSLFPQWCST
jgi:adenosylcobyric acid synthase